MNQLSTRNATICYGLGLTGATIGAFYRPVLIMMWAIMICISIGLTIGGK